MVKKLLIVFLIYTAVNLSAGYFLTKENEWTYKQLYLKANRYPHDWYLIGSSRTRMGVNSQLLGTTTGESVYNLSCSAFFMPSNWEQLEAFLGQVSQKKLIVELTYNVTSIDYYPILVSKAEYFTTVSSFRFTYAALRRQNWHCKLSN